MTEKIDVRLCIKPLSRSVIIQDNTKKDLGSLCGRVVHWFKKTSTETASKTDRVKPFVVCIAGGTGSGKTTLANKIKSALGNDAVIIDQDSYYKELTGMSFQERAKTNFDHPNSIDFERLCQDVKIIKQGQSINKPIYSFKHHAREKEATHVKPAPVTIVEGILVFTNKELRKLADLKIYVDTEDDVRVLRRIERDIAERGRDVANVKQQYLTTVKPMHNQFVGPSKRYADVVISGNADASLAVNKIVENLRKKILQH